MPELTVELLVQGLAALFILLWAGRNALQAKRDTVAATQPNPMVAAVSMAWDRDQQERFLQLIERMTRATEEQAALQKQMAGAWSSMSDRQRESMDAKIERLLEALDDAQKKDLSAMIAGLTGQGR